MIGDAMAVVRLKYVGSEAAPDAGILWGFDVRKGDVIEVGDDHPDRDRLMAHPWFAPVSSGGKAPALDAPRKPDAIAMTPEAVRATLDARSAMAKCDEWPPEVRAIAREHGDRAAEQHLASKPDLSVNAFDEPQPKTRRRRRTKAEMEAARAAEARDADADSE